MAKEQLAVIEMITNMILGKTNGVSKVDFTPQKIPFPENLPYEQAFLRATPESQGVSSEKLIHLLSNLSASPYTDMHHFLVLRHGNVICDCSFAPYRSGIWHISHSMCKSITGMAIGLLIDEGKLSLDENIYNIFPGKVNPLFKIFRPEITVRHLLTMTSGVTFNESGIVSGNDWLESYLNAPVSEKPGTKFQYNSLNSYVLLSSSLPMEIQIEALKKIPAFKDLVIYRPGYAIEYDYFDPTQLKHTLESKKIKNLFFAGQVNGTTGYEEAGGQGIIAGINAHINCHGGEPFTLARDEAYIGVLIDDLVTKGVDEPYRMFTSRAEYRILLRMDDADMRLTERAYKLGLVKEDRYALLKSKREAVENIVNFTRNYSIKAALINDALENLGTTPLRQGCKLIDLINRPQITIENISEYVPAFKRELDKITDERKEEILEAAEILIKYEGYIGRERIIADKLARLESIKIKGKFDYDSLQSLSTEARQKLKKIDPETIAQASRIPGVSPSDINVLLVLSGR